MDGIAHGTHGGTTMDGSASRLAPLAYGYQYRDMAGLAGVTRWLLYALAAITALWLADWAFGYEPFVDRHSEVTALESALGIGRGPAWLACAIRSEEHTSELQSLMSIAYAVFCLNK